MPTQDTKEPQEPFMMVSWYEYEAKVTFVDEVVTPYHFGHFDQENRWVPNWPEVTLKRNTYE